MNHIHARTVAAVGILRQIFFASDWQAQRQHIGITAAGFFALQQNAVIPVKSVGRGVDDLSLAIRGVQPGTSVYDVSSAQRSDPDIPIP